MLWTQTLGEGSGVIAGLGSGVCGDREDTEPILGKFKGFWKRGQLPGQSKHFSSRQNESILYSDHCIHLAPSFSGFFLIGAQGEEWERSIFRAWALLCGNEELKLASRPVGEQLSLDHLKERSRAEPGSPGDQEMLGHCAWRGQWGRGLGAREMEQKGDPSPKCISSPSSPALASSFCFNLDIDQPTTFHVDSAGFGYSVVQYANW